MVIDLNDDTSLALGVETGLLTRIQTDRSRTLITSAEQLHDLLAPLGRDAMAVHLDNLRAWCSIALGSTGGLGVKSTKQTRDKWQTSARLIEGAQALSAEVAEPRFMLPGRRPARPARLRGRSGGSPHSGHGHNGRAGNRNG